MKLLVTRRMTPAAEHALAARFETEFLDREDGFSEAEAARAMAEYDAVMPTLGDRFSAGAFGGDLRCRLLANFGAGFNHIDIAAAANAGIAVTNTPDAVTEATADIALTLILMTARRAGEGERVLRRGEWTGWQPTDRTSLKMPRSRSARRRRSRSPSRCARCRSARPCRSRRTA